VTVGTTAIALGASSLTLGGLTSVAVTQDPASALELATKQYVDAVAQGLDPKASCAAATTANITLSGTQTIDGVALIAGDRCLVKDQTLSQDNGIYLVAAGAWTRATDMDTWAEVPGAFTFVEQGTLYADTGWVCTSNAGGTLGTTPITWVQFAGVGSYTAGTGLTLTGTQFSLTAPVTIALGGTNATNANDARTNLVAAKSGTNSDITELYALNGTSGGVAYQNATNQLIMGSVLTFDGTTLSTTTVDATNLEVTSLKAKDGTAAGSIADATGVVTLASSVLTTTDINGGTIDSTSVGASVASSGAFTNFSASGTGSFTSTGAVKLPVGTVAQRPTPVAGMLRFNDDSDEFEGYNGTAWSSVGGSAITNDTSTATDVYPLFANATTGTAANVYTSNAKLLYKPSTGELKAQELVATNGIVVNSATVSASYTVEAGSNAISAGPITIDSGVTVIITDGTWVIV
jgi:hypothetical protein